MVFGALKLLLELIDEGPSALVKGVLFAMVPSPGSEILDIGETVYKIFTLDGAPAGTIALSDEQRVQFAPVQLLNREQLEQAVARLDFPALAVKEFARMPGRSQEKPEMVKMQKPEFRERRFPTWD